MTFGFTNVCMACVTQAGEFEEEERWRNEKNSSDRQEVYFRHMLKIPFVGQVSHFFKSNILKLFLNELRIEIRPIFSPVKVSNFFSLKSSVSLLPCFHCF